MARKKIEDVAVEGVAVELPELRIKTATLKIVGDSPLIVHAWSDKAKQMMLDKQMKKAAKAKEAKDPFMDFCDSLYWLSEKPKNPTMDDVVKAKFGFPSIAFKAAAVNGGFQSKVTKDKTKTRAAFHTVDEYVEIDGVPEMREDMVRIGQGTADIRYRGEFKNWSAVVAIRYNEGAMSLEQIVNLFNVGGFSNGVGEWRPEKDGSYGMFHVAKGDE